MKVKRFILVSLSVLFLSLKLLAVPANSIPFVVKQPDGSSLTLTLKGDESFHCYVTLDNVPVVNIDSIYYYADMDDFGYMISSNIVAHDAVNRTIEEDIYCKNRKEYIWNQIHSYWDVILESKNVRRKCRRIEGAHTRRNVFEGKKKGLVILVEFENLSMKTENAQFEFNNQFNQKGYSKNGHIGSVHDYFLDQSYGKFDLTFDVVGPFKVSRNYGYYGVNNNRGSDKYPGTMIAEACRLADSKINFADYDWDNDGEVDQVFVIYAGYGESSTGAPSNTIWPHEFNLMSCKEYGDGDGPLYLDGVTINTYACSCELRGSYGSKMNGIGTACHEFSHCLGFPDLYDTGYNGGFGMNRWDLMDAGSHSGPEGCGEVPCGYSAYERYTAGWIDLEELTEPQIIESMPCIADEPVAYKIVNDQNENEFFVLENRQNKGWFSFVGTFNSAHGMIITHVDYNETAWTINKVNTGKSHQRMSIVPADNSYGETYTVDGQVFFKTTEEELMGDPFPGQKNITEFVNTSHQQVGGMLFSTNTDGSYYLNKPIENIVEKDGLISFYFMGGMYIPVPEITSLNVSDCSLTVNWNAVNEADSYSLELIEVPDVEIPINHVLINENFLKFKNSGISDGFKDVSEVLDDYTILSGWNGYKLFTSPSGVKIGTSNAAGYIMTPQFTSERGCITIFVPIMCYNDYGHVKIEMLDANNRVRLSKEFEIDKDLDTIIINSDNFIISDYKIRISSQQRIYISSVRIYDGLFSIDDFNKFENNLYKPIDRKNADNILGTSYTFLNLIAKKYKLRIRAFKDIACSLWSEYEEVIVSSSDDMEELIKNDITTRHIYRINGAEVFDTKSYGLYIIDDGNEKRKVLIK